jgi:hypothetical protein
MALSAVEELTAEPEAHEAAEPPVEAVPKITRNALGYLEPRVGLDGLSMFAKCGSCQNYVPEASMSGALVGSRCAILGSSWPINDDACCDRYVPWGAGLPCAEVTSFFAMELRKRYPGALTPFQAGYKEGGPRAPQCCGCRFFDMPDMAPSPDVAECELYECLNTKTPEIFALDKAIKPYARCSLWTPPEQPEPAGVLGMR